MRITSGEFKGRRLNVPPGDLIRPTTDKIRQAIFNILLQYGLPDGAQVLDAFCGSGALGLEALSRGAEHCIFMDIHKASLECARNNAAPINVAGCTEFLLKDATKLGQKPVVLGAADLVFIDPPYRQGLVDPAIRALVENGWVDQGALVVIEREHDAPDDIQVEGFDLLDSRHYGDTRIEILMRNP